MPAFSYQAIDNAGKRQRGVIEAGNAAAARRALRDQALLPLSVVLSNRSGVTARDLPALGVVDSLRDRLRSGKVSSRSLANATRQLATLIGSEVRIEEALRLVANQGDARITPLLLDVRSKVLEGSGLARALGEHPRAIPAYYRASIQAGEQSGRLSDVLAYLADFVESRQRANQKLVLALLYPALLALVSILMMTAMMVYVVPDIIKVFVSHGADLPLLTRVLIAISNALTHYGLYMLLALLVAAVFIRRELARPDRRLAFDKFLATRRPFSRFSRQTNAARFAATLATLVQSSVPLLDALTASAAVIPNRYIRQQAELVASRVREGDSMHRAMADTGAFPQMLVAIVASGETGGKLGPALGRAASELDREAEGLVAVIVSLVEPAVLLAMGGLVLLMVMAILMPIIALNDLATS